MSIKDKHGPIYLEPGVKTNKSLVERMLPDIPKNLEIDDL
jgi:hypothetical protein